MTEIPDVWVLDKSLRWRLWHGQEEGDTPEVIRGYLNRITGIKNQDIYREHCEIA